MKHYFFNGHEFSRLPNPITLADGSKVSPVTESVFRAIGGMITDDRQPTPEERVCGEFAELITDLAQKTDKITPEEFLQAAQNGISSNLITLARSKGVSEDVIAEGRTRIVEIMADALRYGMTWDKLIQGVIPQAD